MKTLYLLFLFILALLSSPIVWGQGGLQGPFVPIGVETVHINGNTSDVQMLYKATTTGGQDVYAQGVHSMDEAAIVNQAGKRMEDPSATKFQERLNDDGFTYEPAPEEGVGGGAFREDGEIPSDYESTGYCQNPENTMTLGECVELQFEGRNTCSEVNQNTTVCYEFSGTVCDPMGGSGVQITFDIIRPAAANTLASVVAVWYGDSITSGCQDNPGGGLPDPRPPEPPPGDFQKYMSGDPAPEPNPFAPAPKDSDYPPPMMDPDFYREPGGQFFDMQLPSTPTPQQLSDQMTADYAAFTSTAAPSSTPLPAGMSFQAPPSGGTGDYNSPLSGYSVQGGSSNLGGGSGGGGSGGDTTINVQVDVPDICVENPNSLACVDTSVGDEIVPEITVAGFDAGTGFSPITLSNASGCPAPVSIDFLGDSFDIEYGIICDFGADVSPLMLLFASLSGAMIILGVRRAG